MSNMVHMFWTQHLCDSHQTKLSTANNLLTRARGLNFTLQEKTLPFFLIGQRPPGINSFQEPIRDDRYNSFH